VARGVPPRTLRQVTSNRMAVLTQQELESQLVLKKYALPATGELFDRTYAYIRENY